MPWNLDVGKAASEQRQSGNLHLLGLQGSAIGRIPFCLFFCFLDLDLASLMRATVKIRPRISKVEYFMPA